MKTNWILNLLENSDYNSQDQLSREEIKGLCLRTEEGPKTLNGDTQKIEITTRQLLLLLRVYYNHGMF
jgi:hypothetical protein